MDAAGLVAERVRRAVEIHLDDVVRAVKEERHRHRVQLDIAHIFGAVTHHQRIGLVQRVQMQRAAHWQRELIDTFD